MRDIKKFFWIIGSKYFCKASVRNNTDVFVTDAKILERLTPSQISHLLKIEKSNSYSIITFSSKRVTGIAMPINRGDPGFVGG